ncbi:MAG: GAF domain-containing SpoIIE family protein phosphatase, partial [Terrimicrobiaceae bacterium]
MRSLDPAGVDGLASAAPMRQAQNCGDPAVGIGLSNGSRAASPGATRDTFRYDHRDKHSHPMKFQTSCSLHLIFSQSADVSEAVTRLIGFLGDQGVHDQKFLDEFQVAATEAIRNAIEGCSVPGDRFAEITLTVNSLEVQLEIADSNPGESDDNALSASGMEYAPREEIRFRVLRKSLGTLSWNYEPGFRERLLNSMTEEVCASYEMINALTGLGGLLASTGDLASFLREALDRLCDLTRAEAVYVRMLSSDSLVLEGQTGPLPLILQPSLELNSQGVEASVFATGEEVTVIEGAMLETPDPLCGQVQAAFVTPIFFKNERRGVLVLARRNESSGFFTAAQLQVARVVGEYLGIVSTMSELQQRRETEQRAMRELEIAAEIQMSLMPQNFRLNEHLDTFGTCQPALKAGGDYFDLIPLSGGGTLVVIADVMGKGVSAALLANMLRTNIRAQLDLADDPGRLLSVVNRVMAPDLAKLDMFITVACAWISPDGGEIRAASAGHPPGLLGPAGNWHSCLQSQGLPIGVLSDTKYETRLSPFGVGEMLFLYTDGIPEACDPDGEFYDVGGIQRDLAKSPATSARDVVQKVLDSVDYFSNHTLPADDRTLVAIIR